MDQFLYAWDEAAIDYVEDTRLAIPKKFKQAQSTKKQMFIVFFDARGVVLAHAVPQGQTVNAAYYTQVG